jgi:Domain of unknown function (DUF4397)
LKFKFFYLNFEGGYMNKADKFKLSYIFGISLIFYFIGCTDTSVNNIPTTFDFRSEVQLVNLASVSGAATINVINADGTMDGSTGTLNVGNAYPADGQPFMDIPSGSKTFNVTFANGGSTSFKLTIDTERKIRLFLINPDVNSSNLIKGDERYIWQEKGSANAGDLYPADSASISFFNVSPDVSVETISLQGASSSTITQSLDNGKGTPYMLFKAGSYTITFKDTVDLATTTINAQSQGRYSAILYGTQGNLQAKVYTDD